MSAKLNSSNNTDLLRVLQSVLPKNWNKKFHLKEGLPKKTMILTTTSFITPV